MPNRDIKNGRDEAETTKRPPPPPAQEGKSVSAVKGVDAIVNRKRDLNKAIEDAGG